MTPVVSSSTQPLSVIEPTAPTPTVVENTHTVIFYRREENGRARDKEGGGLIILEE